MRKKEAYFFLFILFFVSFSELWAQSSSSDPSMTSSQFDMTGFPQWAKDLRRGEIVAFGSFPFMYFFTNFGYDSYRYAVNGWDRRYAPWPLKAAGAEETTQREKIITLGIAAGGAVLIAFIDYGIVRYKRNRQERDIRNLPPGTPIIIRKPLYGEEGESPPDTQEPDPSESPAGVQQDRATPSGTGNP